MSVLDAWARNIHQDVIAYYYKSAAMIYRVVTVANGQINPPTYTSANLALSAAVLAGASSIALTAKSLTGFVAVGDSFLIAGDATVYTATAPATATGTPQAGYAVTVPIAPVIASGASAGALVAATWLADLPIVAHVMKYPDALIDGTQIRIGDVRVIIPALQMGATVPKTNDRILIDGAQRSLLNVPAMFAGDLPSRYELQAR